jgi:hypothetical protein
MIANNTFERERTYNNSILFSLSNYHSLQVAARSDFSEASR